MHDALDEAPKKDRVRYAFLRKRITFLACAALAGAVLGQLGQLFWFFDLFSHFTLLYFVLMLLGVLATSSHVLRVLFATAAAGMLAWLVWPVAPAESSPERQPQIFLAYNLFLKNERKVETAAWLDKSNVEVIFLSEYTPAWRYALKSLKEKYPYQCDKADDSPFGLALYARSPVSCAVLSLKGLAAEFPYLRAELPDGRVVYGIHPPPPIGRELAAARDASLQQLSELIRGEKAAVIVLGDMNSTPFSPVFREFLQEAGLQLTSPRWRPTWRPGYLPIDHILIRDTLSAKGNMQAGDWLGSDHRPIWIEW